MRVIYRDAPISTRVAAEIAYQTTSFADTSFLNTMALTYGKAFL